VAWDIRNLIYWNTVDRDFLDKIGRILCGSGRSD